VKPFVEKSNRILGSPLGLGPRGLVLLAALLLLPAYAAPLWKMTMYAPQYQGGLRLDIYSYKLEGENGGQDAKEINLLNHYIGMKELSTEEFTEFKWLPFVIGALGLLFLRAVVFGTVGNTLDVTVLFVYFALFSLWSFAYKLWSYGHNLAPTAPVKVPPFMPPLFGGQQIANFEVYSYPGFASYALGGAAAALVAALLLSWRAARREATAGGAGAPARAAG
jgi:copper chaperone NosL